MLCLLIARIILNICHQVQDMLLSSNMKSPPTLTGHFCAPPWLSCCDNNWVCGLKSNMVSKLIKHRKKREPCQSTRKLTASLIQALRAWNSLSQACLVMLSFWDTNSIHKEGPEKIEIKTIKDIKYLKQLDTFLVEH